MGTVLEPKVGGTTYRTDRQWSQSRYGLGSSAASSLSGYGDKRGGQRRRSEAHHGLGLRIGPQGRAPCKPSASSRRLDEHEEVRRHSVYQLILRGGGLGLLRTRNVRIIGGRIVGRDDP